MLNFLFKSKPNYINFGLLFYRLAIGASMFYHGYLKWLGGSQGLYNVGAMLAPLGVTGGYEILGTIAAFAEMVGGILVALGLFTRIGSLMLIDTFEWKFLRLGLSISNGLWCDYVVLCWGWSF